MKSEFVEQTHKWLRLPDDVIAQYNALDTYTTARLVPVLEGLLASNKQLDFYQRWFREMAPVVDRMQARGVGVLDVEAQRTYKVALRKELDEVEEPVLAAVPFFRELETEVHTWYADTLREHPTWVKKAKKGYDSRLKKVRKRRSGFFNRAGGGGSTDLSKLLFDHLGLKAAPKTLDRPARSTSGEALVYVLQHLRVKDEPHRWVLENLLHRARLSTILTRYMVVDCDRDGRVRPLIKLGGTETLRLAYAGDKGEAIQQWPQEARHVIKAWDGCLYLARDYSAIEARLIAILSQDTAMLEVFAAGGDVHKQNAIDLGLASAGTWDAMDPGVRSATRNFAKTFLYGLSYGGSPETMKTKLYCTCPRCRDKVPQTLALGRDDIRRAADQWSKKHEPILQWRAALVETVKGPRGDHTWTSPFGYRRFFLEPRSQAERSIYNFPLQHCASQIINHAMVSLDAAGLPLVLQMHDELMAEVPVERVAYWEGAMRETMEAKVPELGGWSFPTEGARGRHWGEVK